MDFFIYFSLFCFGVLFGSFSSVLINRWKFKEKGIINGRSKCPKCKHTLGWQELIPIISYTIQGGKCRHCKTKISLQYPILETIMGSAFVVGGFINISLGFAFSSIIFCGIIFLLFITVIYIFYDIFFMEIPDEIFIMWLIFFCILFILSCFFDYKEVFFNGFQFSNFWDFIRDKLLGGFFLYSFLFLQILIPGLLYLIPQKKYKDIGELCGLYIVFPFFVVWDFCHEKLGKQQKSTDTSNEEIPTWIGAGDLLLAIIIGCTLGVIPGITAFFFAYCSGSIIGLLLLIFGKIRKNNSENGTEIPFGPFLGIGFLIVLTFYQPILSFIKHQFYIFYI